MTPDGGFTLDWFMRQLDIQGGVRSYVALREDPDAFTEERPLDV